MSRGFLLWRNHGIASYPRAYPAGPARSIATAAGGEVPGPHDHAPAQNWWACGEEGMLGPEVGKGAAKPADPASPPLSSTPVEAGRGIDRCTEDRSSSGGAMVPHRLSSHPCLEPICIEPSPLRWRRSPQRIPCAVPFSVRLESQATPPSFSFPATFLRPALPPRVDEGPIKSPRGACHVEEQPPSLQPRCVEAAS